MIAVMTTTVSALRMRIPLSFVCVSA